MPCQAVAHCTASRQIVGNEGVDVVHGVKLHGGCVVPRGAECGHPALHFTQHPGRLLAQAGGAGVAARDDVVAVIALAFWRLAAAGDYKAAPWIARR